MSPITARPRMARPTSRTDVVLARSFFGTRQIAVSAVLALAALSSCSGGKRADQVVDLCFQSATGADEAINRLQEVSDRFGYRFRE